MSNVAFVFKCQVVIYVYLGSIGVFCRHNLNLNSDSYALACMALLAVLNSALPQDAVCYNMSFALI